MEWGRIYTHQESIETSAAPETVWQLFRDVPGWKAWNEGIEAIPFTSTLLDAEKNRGFTDVTEIDGTRVVVRHLMAALPGGGSSVTNVTKITGPQAADFGPMVMSDSRTF